MILKASKQASRDGYIEADEHPQFAHRRLERRRNCRSWLGGPVTPRRRPPFQPHRILTGLPRSGK